MEKICGIYCIENLVNGKKYVGQSVDIYSRFRGHKSSLRKGCHHNKYLQRAWNKYGEDNFNFYVLENCSIELLDDRERFYIAKFNLCNSYYGYNIESGGNEQKEIGEETRKKISNAMSIVMKDRYNNEEEIEKDRQSLLQYYLEHPEGKEIRRNASIEFYSKHPEVIELCRQYSISYWNNKSNREQHSRKMLERYQNEAERDKQRERALEIWKSNEHKKKQKEGMIHSKIAKPVICIETGQKFPVCSDAMRWLGRNPKSCNMILKVCRGEKETAFGYHWKFANENIESDASNESISNANVCN